MADNRLDRLISFASLLVAIATLLLTSPIIMEYYSKEALEFAGTKLSGGTVKLDILNSGHKKASGVIIEVADTFDNKDKEPFRVSAVHFIPPKVHEVSLQERFVLIKLQSPIHVGEKVVVFITTNLSETGYAHLWLRVTSEDRNYGQIRVLDPR